MFSVKTNELFGKLSESKIMVLATCCDSRVTARSMSFIILNNKLYFQTDKSFLKYSQIAKNPCVAVCCDNIQIEGVCKEISHPLLPENNFFAEKYKKYFSGSFEKYSHLENEVLFEVSPTLITVWDYENSRPYREFFDFINQSHKKCFYE